jgi:hypothetical protein
MLDSRPPRLRQLIARRNCRMASTPHRREDDRHRSSAASPRIDHRSGCRCTTLEMTLPQRTPPSPQ